MVMPALFGLGDGCAQFDEGPGGQKQRQLLEEPAARTGWGRLGFGGLWHGSEKVSQDVVSAGGLSSL